MEDPTIITALNHSGSFGKNFVEFKEKIKILFTSLGRFVLGKIVPSVLSTTLGPRLQAVLKTSGILFPIRTSRPANNVTYMYNMCDFLTQNCNSRLIVPQFK